MAQTHVAGRQREHAAAVLGRKRFCDWELGNMFSIFAGPGKPKSGELTLSSSGKPKFGGLTPSLCLLSVDMNGMDFVKIAVNDVDLKTSYSIIIHICHQ